MKVAMPGVKRLQITVGPEITVYDGDFEVAAKALTAALGPDHSKTFLESMSMSSALTTIGGVIHRARETGQTAHLVIQPDGTIMTIHQEEQHAPDYPAREDLDAEIGELLEEGEDGDDE